MNSLLVLSSARIVVLRFETEDCAMKTNDKKLDMLEELVEAANGKPMLCFYSFRHDLERIKERFPNARKSS